jgi:hypothetical protein
MHHSFQTLGLLGQGGGPAAAAGGDPETRKAPWIFQASQNPVSQTAPINPTEVIVC